MTNANQMALEHCFLPTEPYDLAATLTSGQAFRWRPRDGGWEGVIGTRWVRLRAVARGIEAEAMPGAAPWEWLEDYLQVRTNLVSIVSAFPQDKDMARAVTRCSGLRLLRQDPWECLASFILSSTKQIVQIQQIVARLCLAYGEAVAVPAGHEPWFAFPTAPRLAAASEPELRRCKMGFRAPYLLGAARAVASGELDLASLSRVGLPTARERLLSLAGVGEKIANCVLLFSCGYSEAFPIDVWVARALRDLYFDGQPVSLRRLSEFSARYFGPHAGYAQQYLFHEARGQRKRPERAQAAATARTGRRRSLRSMGK